MVNSYGHFTPASSDTNLLNKILAHLHKDISSGEKLPKKVKKGQVVRLDVDSRSDSSYEKVNRSSY